MDESPTVPVEATPPSTPPEEPAWPTLPGSDIARRLLTVTCVGRRGMGAKAIGFNLVLIPRSKDGLKAQPVGVPTQHYDLVENSPSLGAGHYQALHLALSTMRRRRPDWATAHLAVQVTFWELDQVVRNRSWRKTSQSLTGYRTWVYEELRQLKCTTKATTWYPKRRKETPARYRYYFAKLEGRLRQKLYGELETTDGETLWINLFEVGRAATKLHDKTGKKPTIVEALTYHVVRQRRRKGTELAAALGLDVKAVHNATYRTKAAKPSKWDAKRAERERAHIATLAAIRSGQLDEPRIVVKVGKRRKTANKRSSAETPLTAAAAGTTEKTAHAATQASAIGIEAVKPSPKSKSKKMARKTKPIKPSDMAPPRAGGTGRRRQLANLGIRLLNSAGLSTGVKPGSLGSASLKDEPKD